MKSDEVSKTGLETNRPFFSFSVDCPLVCVYIFNETTLLDMKEIQVYFPLPLIMITLSPQFNLFLRLLGMIIAVINLMNSSSTKTRDYSFRGDKRDIT